MQVSSLLYQALPYLLFCYILRTNEHREVMDMILVMSVKEFGRQVEKPNFSICSCNILVPVLNSFFL